MSLVRETWETERFLSNAEVFFECLREDIEKSQKSIDLAYYIFELDPVGTDFVESVLRAAKRGVKVRILVDGIGTDRWSYDLEPVLREDNVELAVHNPMPWPFSSLKFKELFSLTAFFHLLGRVNWRNHRKLAVIDQNLAFVGGINITEDEIGWEDFAVRISGPSVQKLSEIFESDWKKAYRSLAPSSLRRILGAGWRVLRGKKKAKTWKIYIENLKNSDRIWLVTGYFVPPLKIMRILKQRAADGADVRLVVSRESDIQLIGWVAHLHFKRLHAAGVKIYLHTSRFVHAKCTLLTSEALVGSSNLNHRSFFHDEELDVFVGQKETCENIKSALEDLMKNSIQLNQETQVYRWHHGLIARVIVVFKEWM